MIMRGGRLQKIVLLPFSIRCDSDSSVALAQQSKTTTTAATTSGIKGGGVEKSKMDQAFTKASSFSEGLHRLIRRFKTFSQIFGAVYKGEMEEMDEKEMEIGFPTDVKHVTHIGLDAAAVGGGDGPILSSSSSVGNWEILSFPNSISLHQFELAMAAQSRPTPTLSLPPPLSIN